MISILAFPNTLKRSEVSLSTHVIAVRSVSGTAQIWFIDEHLSKLHFLLQYFDILDYIGAQHHPKSQ